MAPDRLRSSNPVQLVPAPPSNLETSVAKRLIDVLGATLGVVVLAPLLGFIALAIRWETPGPSLFRQRRSGHNGDPFVILKFRTMRVSEYGDDFVNPQQDVNRITRVGRILRRTSFDELPQLVNVLKGEMSLVGPRPHALVHDVYYGAIIKDYNERFRTKPGLTGLAQVSGLRGPTPDDAAMAARVEMDLEYIRHWSALSDVRIMVQTVLVLIFHPGAG